MNTFQVKTSLCYNRGVSVLYFETSFTEILCKYAYPPDRDVVNEETVLLNKTENNPFLRGVYPKICASKPRQGGAGQFFPCARPRTFLLHNYSPSSSGAYS